MLDARFTAREADNGPLKIWHWPDPTRPYSMGVDSAEGLGQRDSDNACIQVLDARTGVQCAEWVSNSVDPNDLGKEVVALGRLYGGPRGQAYAVVEANNHGLACIHSMVAEGYTNMHSRRDIQAWEQKWTNKMGFLTTRQSKITLADKSRAVYRQYPDIVNSTKLRSELAAFQFQDDGGVEAMEGAKDDRVMAWMLAQEGVRFAIVQQAQKKKEKVKVDRIQMMMIRDQQNVSRDNGGKEPKPKRKPRRILTLDPWRY